MRRKLLVFAPIVLFSLILFIDKVFAQQPPSDKGDTAFTYQGRLNREGKPAEGDYDFRFTLYALPEGGEAQSNPITQTLLVKQGLFQTKLDFGPVILAGQARYLEVEVKLPLANTYTVLAPRQEITPAPYALTASSVAWNNVTDVPVGLDTFAKLSCTRDQIAKWSGSGWVCASLESSKVHAQVAATGRVAIPCASFTPYVCSTAWIDIPDMSVTVTTGNNPVLILFKAGGIQPSTPYPSTQTVLQYRLLVDNQEVASAWHEFHNSGWEIRDVSLNWLEVLPAGQHTIKVQFKSRDSNYQNNVSWGDTGSTPTRNLIVIEL